MVRNEVGKEMSTKIGHFEILSELSKSEAGGVYKANDLESGQTIALKAIELSAFKESAGDLEQALNKEAESTKSLSSSNITPVIGAGVIDGKFCATMEYVQGNSVATMLARKEGFSIWDLLDIGRQVSSGLEHAHASNVFHYSLEPSKIMCGWDGTVKILSLGISSTGKFCALHTGSAFVVALYVPEQVRGEAIDARSNIFSLGAMLYEMVTDRKAFDREDAESLRQSIVESTPTPPMHVNAKVHPILSDLIMKALDKDPANRYQSTRELLDDLEKCKESKPAKKAEAPKAATPAKAPAVAGQSVTPSPSASRPVEKKSPAPAAARPAQPAAPVQAQAKMQVPKAAAAAAGWGGNAESSSSAPEFDVSEQAAPTTPARAASRTKISAPPAAYMSSATLDEPEVETFAPDAPSAPRIAVDPMMAEGGSKRGGGGSSFSEISELPPLKEAYVEPPPPPSPFAPTPTKASAGSHAPTMYSGEVEKEEKPKIQPREVAQKAIKEIKGVPPKLMMYSIIGAIVLILIIAAIFAWHVHNLSGDDDSGAARPVSAAPADPAASQPAPAKAAPAPVAAAAQPPVEEEAPVRETAQPSAKGKNAKKKTVAAPVLVPGQMAVESTPAGAQVQVDGKSDPNWVTPFSMTGMQPGQHSVTVSKAGYTTDTRTVEVASGNKASIVIHLAQLMATLAVASDPVGANVYVDGKDSGKLTPAQVSVDKGSHVILVRKMGYIDETTSSLFALGQTVNWSPNLRPLGNADSIKTVGKMKKLFGGNGGQPGQGTVSIRTQPKGAQVAINQHMLDKGSPVDAMLDPGNYVIDITMSGYASIHKVVTVDKGGKVVVDENLQRQ